MLSQAPSTGSNTQPDPGRGARDGRVTGANGPRLRCLIIVARDAPDLWAYLTRTYGRIEGFQVLVDRRERDRRQQSVTRSPDRRQADRRRPPTIERTLRRQPFLFVPQ